MFESDERLLGANNWRIFDADIEELWLKEFSELKDVYCEREHDYVLRLGVYFGKIYC